MKNLMEDSNLSRKIDKAFFFSCGLVEIRANDNNPITLESEAHFSSGLEQLASGTKILISVNDLMQSYDTFFPQANRQLEPWAFTPPIAQYEEWKREVVRGLQTV
jgi:hypothetical protein